MQKAIRHLAVAVGFFGAATCAYAQTGGGTSGTGTTTSGTSTSLGTQTATMDKLATNKGQTLVSNKTASSFVTLAGSKENALALVNGLRNGTAIILTAPTTTGTGTGTGTGGTTTGTGSTGTNGTSGGTGTTTSTDTTITPPTGKMGWGNVFISLSLAQKLLAQAGITDPTAAQLKIALMGGDLVGADGNTVAVKGVLQLRADGMGWGKIAQVYGTKLGPVVSEMKTANKQIATAPDSGTTNTGTSAAGASSTSKLARVTGGTKSVSNAGVGITTAGAGSAGSAGGKGLSTAGGKVPNGKVGGIVSAGGSGNGNGNAFGKGVVTAAGGSAAGTASAASAVHGARPAIVGAGLVTATGAAASNATSGLTSANGAAGNHGNGNGNANGKGKNG